MILNLGPHDLEYVLSGPLEKKVTGSLVYTMAFLLIAVIGAALSPNLKVCDMETIQVPLVKRSLDHVIVGLSRCF